MAESSSQSCAIGSRELARLSPASLALCTERRFRCPAHVGALDDALLRAIGGEGPPRLIVEMPPRHGKSEMISRFLPAWYLGAFPTRRVILSSYEADFAASWGRKARDLLLEFGPALFGVEVRRDASAANRFDLRRHGGGMVSAGIGGPIMGRGAHLLVIDDPVKNADQAGSKTIRDKHWDWFCSTAYSRLEPGAVVVIVMTRWHEDDLIGRLLAAQAAGGERWARLRLPALAERGDPLGRAEGEPLWPERYSGDDLAAIRKAVSPYFWAALYQQRPSPPEGQILRREWWRYYEPERPPQVDELIQSWDCSFKQTDDSSYVVGQVWIRNGAHKYLVKQVRGRFDFVETVRQLRVLTKWVEHAYPKQGSHLKLVEDKANGPAVIAALRREVAGLVAVDPRGSKEARAHAIAPQLEAGNVYLPAPEGTTPRWVKELIEECAAFPNGATDDQVDAMTQALVRMASAGGGGEVRSGRVDPARLFDR